ncbi:MAG: hypothetical protein COV59_01860 [Candidatus Magasanikbacteria bacterium CG11_big_fil_rev_8_21_14_0_20_39_34]|uniref:2'-5' RNA ligase n=1 Tax=Candidatus Magasanikbacteria bacterium CG11_big_fil_rev_8_21_14_0_20_39_34 TaxID=1974653 RepID=A0A2H0N4U6_9BACT|nr:MAG: hypothetical protein COV59_01860 [Candidatus Magasanikbacteria bacterium CG11_big_fil_rev_8_21_14_0_20_39_34]
MDRYCIYSYSWNDFFLGVSGIPLKFSFFMNRRVIDIVIIPPKEILDLCIEQNNVDFEKNLVPIKFSKNDFIPHLSLFMGVLSSLQEDMVKKEMKQITKTFSGLDLCIPRIENNWIYLEKTDDLQTLQKNIAKNIEPHVTHDAQNSDFFVDENEVITPDCYPWVNNFFTDYSFDNFVPHITTWSKTPFSINLPLSFKAERIALCHVGKFNTCRKILWENT